MAFKQIDIKDCNMNFVEQLQDRYSVVSATSEGKTNMLTVAWAAVGFYWQLPVCSALIRPSRYTREFIDASGNFTVSFFGDEFAEDVMYLGTHSGRDEDKLAKTNLHLLSLDGHPAYEEAKLVLCCRTIYKQPLEMNCMLDAQVEQQHYAGRETSINYIGQIEQVFVKDNR